jgi:hypothetical protein
MGMEQAFMAGAGTPGGSAGGAGGEGGTDAFQAFICGELGPDQMLVGEGQALTKEVVELFAKVDGKLRVSPDEIFSYASQLTPAETLFLSPSRDRHASSSGPR